MNRRSLLLAASAVSVSAFLPAFAQNARTETLEITGGFSRATAKSAMAGIVFVTIRSLGGADRLIGFTSPACNRPELHTHIHDNGIMRMREVEAVDIPVGGEVRLEPGGLHLMLIDLNTQLVEGENIDVTLVFENAGEVSLKVPVKGPGAME